MSIHLTLPPTFAQVLRESHTAQPAVGLWVCSGSPTAAEITASSGCDWVLIDGEHSPIGLESTLGLLRAVAPYPATPVVRVPTLDAAAIKQFLDLGAQNIMVPMINTAGQAQEAVAAMHYPPRGIRGVGSALARSSRWNRVEEYLSRAEETVSLTLQIETSAAVEHVEQICQVEGVDALFIGPSDLAASMGLLGQQQHPQVVDAVKHCIAVARDSGTLVGVNAFIPDQARDYLAAGANFVNIGADVQLLAKSTSELVAHYHAK